jgi:DNA-binding transcriptional LysR family regulator
MSTLGTPPLSPSLLAWLRCFDAAARCGSFTRAAHELHVSQGAVSQQVKKLEDWLGHPLLVRTAAGLALTAEGECLFPITRESFGGLAHALHRLRAPRKADAANDGGSPSFAVMRFILLGYQSTRHLAA